MTRPPGSAPVEGDGTGAVKAKGRGVYRSGPVPRLKALLDGVVVPSARRLQVGFVPEQRPVFTTRDDVVGHIRRYQPADRLAAEALGMCSAPIPGDPVPLGVVATLAGATAIPVVLTTGGATTGGLTWWTKGARAL